MSSSTYKCNFCGKDYSCLASLRHHQKHTKQCLELQNKQTTSVCTYCNKPFANIYTLQTHIGICKHKKETETQTILQEYKLLKEEYAKLKEQHIKLNEQHIKLNEKYDEAREQISTFLRSGIQVSPTSANNTNTINSNNTTNVNSNNTTNVNSNNNVNNSYSMQFNILFDKLSSFNETNVINSIKKLSDKEQLSQLDYSNFQKEILKKLVTCSINNFTFFTDIRRKIMVMKKHNGEAVKRHIDDFLIDYVAHGKDEIIQFMNNASLYMDDLVNNDMLESDDIWYAFKESRDKLEENLRATDTTTDIKKTQIVKQLKTEIDDTGVSLKKR